MKQARCTCAALAMAAALLLAGASRPSNAAGSVSAIDDAGQRVTLPVPARRIVALGPHLPEQLFAIGAGERVVGTTEYADWPPEANRIPRIARAHSVDLERVTALKPDLVIVWGSGYPPATLEALRRLGVPVYVNEPGRLDDIATSMEKLGVLTAAPHTASAVAALRAQIAALRERHAQRAPVRVFYQIWQQPLMTLSGRHVVNDVIRACGGRNVFEALVPIAPQVSTEAVLAADPQLIVTAEAGGKPGTALDGWIKFERLSAVRLGMLVTLDADKINRHAPRIVDEAAMLCEHIERARRALATTTR